MSKKLSKSQKKEVQQNRQERAAIAATAKRLLELFATEESGVYPEMSLVEETIHSEDDSEKMMWGTWFLPGGELAYDRGYGFCMVSYNGSTFTFKLKANNEVQSFGFVRTLDVTEEAVRAGAMEMRLVAFRRALKSDKTSAP